ncbi:hypothetical protein Cgig2_033664 [Carnegiea gigantea]|uniref:Uncharacterized protein n=1 Tax=Carnegiea gigantea TaxID=171969 RepID=A0A9Q1GRT7_9CARY|nr:hypothetical protein Cgig2_033664 [Carnegiea gigantea]
MLIRYSNSPKPKVKFQFCDMWCKHENFFNIIDKTYSDSANFLTISQSLKFLNHLRPLLRQLSRDHFTDLRTQQENARRELNNVQLALQHDQSNHTVLQKEKEVEWIKYGGGTTRFCFVKAKQKKLTSYIFTIKDEQGNQKLQCQRDKRGHFLISNIKSPDPDGYSSGFFKSTWHLIGPMVRGCSQELQEKCKHITGLQDSNFPLRYLGVPITASRLTKVECRSLVEKITAKMKIWASRSLLNAGKVVLINSVVFGMFNYRASIFMLPTEVVSKITQLYRNYLWGGIEEFHRVPLISW